MTLCSEKRIYVKKLAKLQLAFIYIFFQNCSDVVLRFVFLWLKIRIYIEVLI